MAKKKTTIELLKKDIRFKIERQSFQIIRFHPLTMDLDVNELDEKDNVIATKRIVFAHLPKNIKKMIKPN